MPTIIKNLCKKYYSSNSVEYIVIHYTGSAEGTALAVSNYFKNSTVSSSAHYVVDWNSIYQCVEEKYGAWHAGNSYYNKHSIGIEICCHKTNKKSKSASDKDWYFDNDTLKPTYKLLLGIPGLSHAVNIASNLGLNQEIIDEATNIINIKQNNQNINSNLNNELIGKILNTHNKIEKQNKELEQKERDVKKIEKEYIEKLETLKNEKRKNLTNFKKKYQNKYEKTRNELKDIIENAKKANDKKVFANAYNKIANLEKTSFTMFEEDENELRNNYKKIDWNNIKSNDKVLLKNLNQPAVFLNHVKKGKTVQIQLGNIKTVVEIDKLAKYENSYINKNLKSKKFKKQKPFEFERNSVPSKVDLRGMNVDEALRTVEYYVDKAILANMTNLTIIAGKGTGALKQAVGDYVKNSSYITKYRTGTMEEGGDCVFFIEV